MRNWLTVATVFVGAAAAALGLFLGARPAEAMPWKAARRDVLSVFFGDARLALSQAMAHKADSYFHGGVDIDWHEHECHHHGRPGEDADGDEAARDRAAEEASEAASGGGPWVWIDARIHAQQHRHLEGSQARELLPWYWAACRADPHNVAAYQSTAYVLTAMLHSPTNALGVLDEGIRLNPGTPELEFDKGQLLDAELKDRASAEAAFRQTVAKAAAADSDDNRRLRVRALFYLALYARDRGDAAAVRRCYAEARALLPNHISTVSIGRMVK